MDFLIDLVTPYLGKETLKGAWAMGFFGRPANLILLGCFRASIYILFISYLYSIKEHNISLNLRKEGGKAHFELADQLFEGG